MSDICSFLAISLMTLEAEDKLMSSCLCSHTSSRIIIVIEIRISEHFQGRRDRTGRGQIIQWWLWMTTQHRNGTIVVTTLSTNKKCDLPRKICKQVQHSLLKVGFIFYYKIGLQTLTGGCVEIFDISWLIQMDIKRDFVCYVQQLIYVGLVRCKSTVEIKNDVCLLPEIWFEQSISINYSIDRQSEKLIVHESIFWVTKNMVNLKFSIWFCCDTWEVVFISHASCRIRLLSITSFTWAEPVSIHLQIQWNDSTARILNELCNSALHAVDNV